MESYLKWKVIKWKLKKNNEIIITIKQKKKKKQKQNYYIHLIILTFKTLKYHYNISIKVLGGFESNFV